MKKIENKIKIVLVLSFIFLLSIVGLFIAPSLKNVKADEQRFFQMENSVTLRLNGNGLRFRAKMNQTVKDDIYNNENKNLYFIIMPAKYLSKTGNKYDMAIERDKDGNFDEVASHCLYIKVNNNLYYEDGFWIANGGVANVNPANRNLDFVAIACIETKNGDDYSYEYASYPDNMDKMPATSQYDTLISAILYTEEDYSNDIASQYSWFGTDEYPVEIASIDEYNNLRRKVNKGEDALLKNLKIVIDEDKVDVNSQDVIPLEEGKQMPEITPLAPVAYNYTVRHVREGVATDDVENLTGDVDSTVVAQIKNYNGYIIDGGSTLTTTLDEDNKEIVINYKKGIKIGGTENAYISASSSKNGVEILKNQTIAGTTADALIFTKEYTTVHTENAIEAPYTHTEYQDIGVRVLGLTAKEIQDNNYKKISLKMYFTSDFNGSALKVNAQYTTNETASIGTLSASRITFDNEHVLFPSSLFMYNVFNESGELMNADNFTEGWYTLEISLYRNAYLLNYLNGEIEIYISLIENSNSNKNKPLYIKDVAMSSDNFGILSENVSEGQKITFLYGDGVNRLYNFNATASEITSNGYKKLTMLMKSGSDFDVATRLLMKTSISDEILLKPNNITTGKNSNLFRIYNLNGERIYNAPKGEWFRLEVSLYNGNNLINIVNGKLDFTMQLLYNTSSFMPSNNIIIKDVDFSTDSMDIYQTTDNNGVLTVNYPVVGSSANAVKFNNYTLADISANGVKKLTMKIKANAGFDLSTIYFDYQFTTNVVGTLAENTIILNSANIGSGINAALFAVYDENNRISGNALDDTSIFKNVADKWFTVEINLRRRGYLLNTDSDGLKLTMYAGSKTTTGSFQIKDVALSTEEFVETYAVNFYKYDKDAQDYVKDATNSGVKAVPAFSSINESIIYEGYVLNAVKSNTSIVELCDCSNVLNLYYDLGIEVADGVYLSSKNCNPNVTSVKGVNVGDEIVDGFILKGHSSGNTIDLLGINGSTIGNYQKLSFKVYITSDYLAENLLVKAVYNNNISTTSDGTIRINNANLANNSLFKVYDKNGNPITSIANGTASAWYTIEMSLYRAGYILHETNGVFDFGIYTDASANLNKPLYFKDVKLSEDDINLFAENVVLNNEQVQRVQYAAAIGQANSNYNNAVKLGDYSVANSTGAGYKKLTFKLLKGTEINSQYIYIKGIYNVSTGGIAEEVIRISPESGNLGLNGTKETSQSGWFRAYDKDGNRVYNITNANEWYTIEVSLYRETNYGIAETNGHINLFVFVGNSAAGLNKPFYIKDVKLSKESMAAHIENDGETIIANYVGTGTKNSDNFRLAEIGLEDISSNNYKKITMEITPSTGFDASTIFVYAVYYSNATSGFSSHEIRLNNGNIGSGTNASLFAMYDEGGTRIYDVPGASASFTLEINLYRAGYTIQETDGLIDIFMYVGNNSTLGKPFTVSNITLSTEAF